MGSVMDRSISLSHSSSRSGFSTRTNFWNLWPNREVTIEKNGAANIPEKCHEKEFVASVFRRIFGFTAQQNICDRTDLQQKLVSFLSQTKNSRICSRFRSCSLPRKCNSQQYVFKAFCWKSVSPWLWYPCLDVFPCFMWKRRYIFLFPEDYHNSHHLIPLSFFTQTLNIGIAFSTHSYERDRSKIQIISIKPLRRLGAHTHFSIARLPGHPIHVAQRNGSWQRCKVLPILPYLRHLYLGILSSGNHPTVELHKWVQV